MVKGRLDLREGGGRACATDQSTTTLFATVDRQLLLPSLQHTRTSETCSACVVFSG